MYNNKILFIALFTIAFGVLLPYAAIAQDMTQDAAEDGTRILGTTNTNDAATAEIATEDDTAISEEGIMPEAAILDPDFLSDDTESYDDYSKVVIRILDKVTAESRTYDLNINKTVAFGSIRIQPKTCKKAPPIEEPESAAFLQIWEKTPEMKDEWVFSGWMFASSPSLSSMEHPVYDVWVLDCKD